MNLEMEYYQDVDAMVLTDTMVSTSEKRPTRTVDLESTTFVMIDFVDEISYEPVNLELLSVSGHLPLEQNEKYRKETDTLTFGEGVDTATLITENGDLVAYWRPSPTDYNPERLCAIAVDLRNASKYLSSLPCATGPSGNRKITNDLHFVRPNS